MKLRCTSLLMGLAIALPVGPLALAQNALPAQQAAPIDLTGYWVSVITEDWRWRMLTAPKGDYASVPLNAAGRKLADQFDPALYGGATGVGTVGGGGGVPAPVQQTPIGTYQVSATIDCRAYGAGGIMRMPTRVKISWRNPNELQLQTDWGEQTRVFHFAPNRAIENRLQPLRSAPDADDHGHGPPTPQGYSVAVWELPYLVGAPAYRRGAPPRAPGAPRGNPDTANAGGDLAVVTGDLAPGWLRRNGVPYGGLTQLIEHYQTFEDAAGTHWFDVTTEVIDPEYLTTPFITSSDFQQEPNAAQWAPHPCKQVGAL
jgi:hypothetical protein